MSKNSRTGEAPQLIWNADPRALWGMDAGAFIIGSIALLLMTRLRILISLPFAAVVILGMASVFAAEIGGWYARGVRRVRVEDGVLVLEERPGRAARRLTSRQITRVRRTRRLGGGRILIEVRQPGTPPWKRLLPPFFRGRIALRAELFSPRDFHAMYEEIRRLASRRVSLT